MVRAWYMDTEKGDQREPHMTEPPCFVQLDELKKFGINYWKIDADNFETCPTLKEVRTNHRYEHGDQVICHKGCPGYEEMIKTFFEEHIHSDDEIRLVLDGSGYFDIRNPTNDKWIRIETTKNDMICVPSGLYHRFTLDTKDYIKANRYFSENTSWSAFNRPQDNNPVRVEYLKKYGGV